MPGCALSKKAAHSASENVFTLFCFHYNFCIFGTLTGLTTSDHVAVAGFSNASFEGGKKSGASSSGSLDFQGL